MKIGLCDMPDKAVLLPPGTFDYMELTLSVVQAMTDEEIRHTAKLLRQAGLCAEATNGFFPASIRLCGKDYRPDTVAEYTRRALHNGAELGIHTCILGSSRSRNIDEGEDRASCLAQFEEAVAITAEIAEPYGTDILLEPLNTKESNHLNTVAEGAAICRRLAIPNLYVVADYFHIMAADESMDVLRTNRDLIRHVHIADPERNFPRAASGHDFSPFRDALADMGYDARISVEAGCPGEFVSSCVETAAYLRGLFC